MTGAHSTCTLLSTLPLFPCPCFPSFQWTHTLYPPCKQLLITVLWDAGCSWCLSLFPSSLVHLYLSHSTPFHPMSNCSWQQLWVLHGAGFIVSPPLSSLSTHLPLISLPCPALVPRYFAMVVMAPPLCCCCPASYLALSPPLCGGTSGGPLFMPTPHLLPPPWWSLAIVPHHQCHCSHGSNSHSRAQSQSGVAQPHIM
jgi:hypothetical protein